MGKGRGAHFFDWSLRMTCKPCKVFNKRQNFKPVQLKVVADNKIIVTLRLKFVLGRTENVVGKGEKTGTSLFSFFHSVFKSFLFQRCLKSGLCGNGLTLYPTIPTFNYPKEGGF